MTEGVQIRRTFAQCLPHPGLIGILGIIQCPHGRSESDERESVRRRGDGMRSIPEEQIAPLTLWGVDRAGNDAEVAIQLLRVARGDERPTLHRRLDNDRQLGERRDESISLWKRSAVR